MIQSRSLTVSLILLGLLAGLVLFPSVSAAQGPYTASSRFEFEAPPNILQTVAEAQTFTPRVQNRGVDLAPVSGMTCAPATAPRTGITCSVPMGAANATTLNAAGAHAISVAFFRADLGVGAFSDPFGRLVPAAAPTAVRVTP